jgi:hypothetical protein
MRAENPAGSAGKLTAFGGAAMLRRASNETLAQGTKPDVGQGLL